MLTLALALALGGCPQQIQVVAAERALDDGDAHRA